MKTFFHQSRRISPLFLIYLRNFDREHTHTPSPPSPLSKGTCRRRRIGTRSRATRRCACVCVCVLELFSANFASRFFAYIDLVLGGRTLISVKTFERFSNTHCAGGGELYVYIPHTPRNCIFLYSIDIYIYIIPLCKSHTDHRVAAGRFRSLHHHQRRRKEFSREREMERKNICIYICVCVCVLKFPFFLFHLLRFLSIHLSLSLFLYLFYFVFVSVCVCVCVCVCVYNVHLP